MPFAEWIPRLQVHVPVLDEQHQVLFAWINRTWDAYQSEDLEELKVVLDFLENYTVQHFSTEERLMDQAGYGDADHHKGLHGEFRDRIEELQGRLRQSPHSLGPELLEYLKKWLVHHIAVEDRLLGAFLAGRGFR